MEFILPECIKSLGHKLNQRTVFDYGLWMLIAHLTNRVAVLIIPMARLIRDRDRDRDRGRGRGSRRGD
jgi:hypothetical protein